MRATLLLALAMGCTGGGVPKIGDSVSEDSGEARPVDADRDGYTTETDCDDLDGQVSPGALEICDDVDNDCDGLIDAADDDIQGGPWYTDGDGDGYGDDASASTACVQPEGTVAEGGDCDDADAATHPNAEEGDCADPTDYNCDGSTGFSDADGDGFGACQECDDADAAVHPGADEVCDGLDNDCDGLSDDADDVVSGTSTWYTDGDGDGYGADDGAVSACAAPEGAVAAAGDCDDADAATHPDAAEPDCTDPKDYNCDGSVAYADADGDSVAACEDCDDADPAAYPGGVEVCDGADNDCDGATDDGDADVADPSPWYTDSDGDGYGDAAAVETACTAPADAVAIAGDCDDDAAGVHPGATETCNDADDDCDSKIDDADTGVTGTSTWYKDADADAYGDKGSTKAACDAPSGYVADKTDCNDAASAIHPGATETCDDADNDCDSLVDDADSGVTGTSIWYKDADLDGYGDKSASSVSCDAPAGSVADKTDCDDRDNDVNPGATEICNSDDDDCDGLIDDDDSSLSDGKVWYGDADGDKYGQDSASTHACEAPSGYVEAGGDCDDGDADTHPDAKDACDGVDNDCSDYADDGGDCPCTVDYYDDGHAYMFCRAYSSWNSGLSYCEKYGYSLASIADADEDAWVQAAATAVDDGTWWWIGYTDASTEGTWVWSDGSSASYADWATDEPNNRYNQDCALFVADSSAGWYDSWCSGYTYVSFVCEAE